MTRMTRLIAVALVAAITWIIPALAQDEAPGIFGEVIDVRVVNLEVVVTDKDGVRVIGLEPEDFVLSVDGRPLPIEYFTAVVGGTSLAPGAAEGTVPALAPGRPVSTSYLVFVDEYFAIKRDRDRALRALSEQLPLLSPEDRMAVVAYDGKSVDMLSTWSQSKPALERVFVDARERPAHGLQRRAELRNYRTSRGLRGSLDSRDFTVGPADLRLDLDLEEEGEAERIATQVERSVLAAAAALRGFANPPGRKVLILLAGGWPYNPVQWVIDDPSRLAYANQVRSGDELLQPLIEAANRLSYTIYAADVPGLNPVLAEDIGLTETAGQSDPTLRFTREQEMEHTLGRLAKETGGRAFLNSASDNIFEGAVEDTRSYYWLGFTPTWAGTDEVHDIRVTTKNKRHDVRTRRSYADLSAATEVTMMVESTLLFGNSPGAESLSAVLGTPTKAGRGKLELPFRLALPLHELTFLPEEGGVRARLELRVAVIDDDGNTAEIPVVPIEITSEGPPEGEAISVYESRLRLRKRPHDIVFSLYESVTGRILSTRVRFEP